MDDPQIHDLTHTHTVNVFVVQKTFGGQKRKWDLLEQKTQAHVTVKLIEWI